MADVRDDVPDVVDPVAEEAVANGATQANLMSLREYYAGMALVGLFGHPLSHDETALSLAVTAVELADALLRVLAKEIT